MLLFIKILIILLLLMVFVQDMKIRSVYWTIFPVLMILFIALYYFQYHSIAGYWHIPGINAVFLLLQLILVSGWFSLTAKKWVNITHHLLGLGDILFLCTLIFVFALYNFVLFYIGSLIAVLIIWQAGKRILFKNNPHIPLAGLQALLLIGVLIYSWLKPLCITSDDWLIKLVSI